MYGAIAVTLNKVILKIVSDYFGEGGMLEIQSDQRSAISDQRQRKKIEICKNATFWSVADDLH